jgi:hypothetical protein
MCTRHGLAAIMEFLDDMPGDMPKNSMIVDR